MLAIAASRCSCAACPRFKAVVMVPVPNALVSTSRSPGCAPPLVRTRPGCTRPVTASPYFGSLSWMVCPPAMAAPTERSTSAPPRRISERSGAGKSGGNAAMFKANNTSPPIA